MWILHDAKNYIATVIIFGSFFLVPPSLGTLWTLPCTSDFPRPSISLTQIALPLLIYLTIILLLFSWSQLDIPKKFVLLNIHCREWMVSWLRTSQENFHFVEEVVGISQCLMGRISGVNIRFYLEVIRYWSQSFMLCGKATKLREAALLGRGVLPGTLFPPSSSHPSHQLPVDPSSVHPSVHHLLVLSLDLAPQCPHLSVLSPSLTLLHSVLEEVLISPHMCLVIFSAPLPPIS